MNNHKHSIEKMCKVLKVSRNSYYHWLKGYSKNAIINRYLLIQIKNIHKESNRSYGSKKIFEELISRGLIVSKYRIDKLTKKHGIKSSVKKKFRVTTDSNHFYSIAPNLLKREFKVEKPSKTWVSDISYVWTKQGWLYLTTVIDLFDRKVIGWSISQSLKTEETSISALKMAMNNRSISKDLIFHSDRGVQYAATEFKNLLNAFRITQSMSRKGNCWDNAVAESFFRSIKTECIYQQVFHDRKQAKLEIFAYIEYWYNRKRRHAALNYLTPEEKEQQYFNQLNLKYVA